MNDERLSGHHARVLSEILGHPTPRNLEWPDVVSLISAIGSSLERHDGKFEFRVGATMGVFRRPHHKNLDVDDVVRLRRLLTQAGMTGEKAVSELPRVVTVVDHHSARFFEPEEDNVHLVERGHIEPSDPRGFEHHLEHRKEAHYQGERIPEDDAFYELIAQRLKGFDSILLVGDAAGKSSAVDYLSRYLEKKHSDVWDHVIASEHDNLSALTTGEIERIAKGYATSP